MAAPTKNTLRVLEFYSGIGGMHWALNESGLEHKVIAAYDVNGVANKIYQHNFPETPVIDRSIEVIGAAQFKDVDMVLMSPPCQPYTRVGKQHDLNDLRARSFLHILDLLPRLEKHPSYLLVENVKGFEISESRNKLVDTITRCNYSYQELLLTPLQFGIPNSRLRYFLIAKQKPRPFAFNATPEIMQMLPDCCARWLTYRIQAELEIASCVCGGYHGNKNNNADDIVEFEDKITSSDSPAGSCIVGETTVTGGSNNNNNNIAELADVSHNATTSCVDRRKHKHTDENELNIPERSNCKRKKTDNGTTCLAAVDVPSAASGSSLKTDLCITEPLRSEPVNTTDNEHCLQNYGHNLRQCSREQYGPCLKLQSFLEATCTDLRHFEPYLLPDKFLKLMVIMDIVNPCSYKSTCFTKRYGRYILGAGSLVQMCKDVECVIAVSKLKDRAVAMKNRDDWGNTEYEVIRRLQLRYFTPREAANILCFPKSFGFPDDATARQRYMVLGNSLNVHIVSVLIRLMTCEPQS